ncbi:MAG: hypothetical protein ACR2P2_16295 [Nakamurella sp.]
MAATRRSGRPLQVGCWTAGALVGVASGPAESLLLGAVAAGVLWSVAAGVL